MRSSIHTTDAVAAVTDTGCGRGDGERVHARRRRTARAQSRSSPDAIERAIDLNGVAVDKNLAAFRLGRRDARLGRRQSPSPLADESTSAMIARLQADLADYQSPRYAAALTARSSTARRRAARDDFTRAVAFHLHKLMAYKDEYEVARLLLRPESRAAAEAVGGPGAKVQWNLHPPMLRAMG